MNLLTFWSFIFPKKEEIPFVWISSFTEDWSLILFNFNSFWLFAKIKNTFCHQKNFIGRYRDNKKASVTSKKKITTHKKIVQNPLNIFLEKWTNFLVRTYKTLFLFSFNGNSDLLTNSKHSISPPLFRTQMIKTRNLSKRYLQSSHMPRNQIFFPPGQWDWKMKQSKKPRWITQGC